MTTVRHLSLICGLLFASLTLPIHAEQAIQSQNYAIHYNAFNTMIVSPEVAQTYGFTRARNRALLNISIIDNTTKEPLPAMVTGTRTNIVGQLIKLEFIQVKEKNAIYYIAPLRFTEGEMWRFDLQIQPDLKSDAIPLKFSQSFYLEQ